MVYQIREVGGVSLYCLRSTVAPDRFYFGITVRPAARMREHINKAARGSTGKISCAIRKYGASTFEMVVLATFPSRLEASAAEQEIIGSYGGVRSPLLWNTTGGGDGGYSEVDLSPESREAFLATWSKRKSDKEWSAARSAKCREAWSKPGAKQQHSERCKLAWKGDGVLAKRAATYVKTRRSAASRLKNSFFIRGIAKDDENDVVVFLSVCEAMRAGYDGSAIYKCLNGKAKIAGGRRWEKITTEEGLILRTDIAAEIAEVRNA